MFPDGGWECNKCQNYNFKGRKECFRCKKAKSSDDQEGKPEHMYKSKQQKKNKNKKKGLKNDSEEDTACSNENSSSEHNSSRAKAVTVKKPAQERVGDWTCQQCFNHNFSFRSTCNKCQLSQEESTRFAQEQTFVATLAQ